MPALTKRPNLNLGDLVKDTVTGFTGVIVAYTTWLNGCIRVTVQPRELKDGKAIESCGFDIEQMVLVEAGVIGEKPVEKRTGGPMPDVRREGV